MSAFDPLDLPKWPLMHGSVHSDMEALRTQGLLPPAITNNPLNSFDYDAVLGRVDFVYLAPANHMGNYGFGAFVLVDPAVLLKPGVRFALQDVGKAVEYVGFAVKDRGHRYAHRWSLPRPDLLDNVIKAVHVHDPDASRQEMTLRIIRSAAFKEYVQFFEMGPEEFFARIGAEMKRRNWTLDDYFGRLGTWPLREEIAVPGHVEPAYLLGYWDGATWTPWSKPKCRETIRRLNEFIQKQRPWRPR